MTKVAKVGLCTLLLSLASVGAFAEVPTAHQQSTSPEIQSTAAASPTKAVHHRHTHHLVKHKAQHKAAAVAKASGTGLR